MKQNVLLVEDNPATVDIIQTELEFLGYETIIADNGKKAVEMAAAHLPDLIIMDISLPKMDGLDNVHGCRVIFHQKYILFH